VRIKYYGEPKVVESECERGDLFEQLDQKVTNTAPSVTVFVYFPSD